MLYCGLDILEVVAEGVEHGAEEGDVDDFQIEPDPMLNALPIFGEAVALVFPG